MSFLSDALRALFERMRPQHPADLGDANFFMSRMASSPPEELPAIEEEIRVRWRDKYVVHPEAAQMAKAVSNAAAPSVHLLGLASFHPSGYVREEAVKRLAAFTDGSELPYLLLRLSDWVPQVREAATRAVHARIREAWVTPFARALPLVDRAARAERVDRAALLEPLARIFDTAAGQEALLAVIRTGSRRAARSAMQFFIERVPARLNAAVDAGANADDAVIRFRAATFAAGALPSAEALRILERLASDSSPAVRRESLERLAESFPEDARALLERAVLDTSRSVREVVRFLLRGVPIDFASLYRAEMNGAATSRGLAVALGALGDVGVASDAQSAGTYLTHARPAVRRAAIKCAMRLAGDAFRDRVVGMLEDPSQSVSAAARNAVRAHAPALDAARLRGMFRAATLPHVRANVVHVLAALPKWQSITPLLEAATVADEDVAALARKYVGVWNRDYNRSQATPSRRDVEELAQALVAAEGALDPGTVEELRFTIWSLG